MTKNLEESLSLENSLIMKLIEFVKNHDEIAAVTKGYEPEERFQVYYFITKNISYNSKIEDDISEFDLRLNNEEGHDCNLMSWPNCKISDYYFLGDVIYKKENK